ncbi:MAG: SDR family oxidoreductase [Bryobacterales bacterium]|nr:SDR family oxidoreductase [Acidobacteriota bacterium]MCB9384466.1 SDR family oxidoreductase [Bryobacterales bacterium]
MRFQSKSALVTGSATGIGRAVAVRFAREGASVALNYYDTPPEETLQLCRQAQAESGAKGTLFPVQCDVSKEDQIVRMVAESIEALGGIDVLINNAGILKADPSEDLQAADFDKVLAVNLRGAFLCAREAIRHFLTRGGGVIVNNSSVHEIIPKPNFLSYSVSKGGLENLTRTLALEYADRGIRVNAVGPGAILTPMNDAWADDPEARAGVESHIPMGRSGRPEEMAAVFAFLASDEASYITGQTLYADGGLTLFPEFRGTWSTSGS